MGMRKPYNWRKHVKPKTQNKIRYDYVEITKEYADLLSESLKNLKEETGRVYKKDIFYHINLIKRIIKHKLK
jgi:hypothetical protein